MLPPGKRHSDPVTFKQFARQGRIITGLFREPLLPPRSLLQVSKRQYGLLRRYKAQYEKDCEEESKMVY